MKMVSMAQEEKSMEDYPEEHKEPKYPYGLEIHLDDDQLKKLGITDLPKVGAEILLYCKAKFTSTSEEEKADDETCSRCSLQITEMGTQGPTKGMFNHPSRAKEED